MGRPNASIRQYAELRNAKTGSIYANDYTSYHALSNLLIRARIDGHVQWESIEDAARAAIRARGWSSAARFIANEKSIFLEGYERNFMQSQPAHIAIVFEKLTVQSILQPVANKYTLPMLPMRGMTSGTAKQELYDRFSTSGKAKLVLLIAGDLDPAGEVISNDVLH